MCLMSINRCVSFTNHYVEKNVCMVYIVNTERESTPSYWSKGLVKRYNSRGSVSKILSLLWVSWSVPRRWCHWSCHRPRRADSVSLSFPFQARRLTWLHLCSAKQNLDSKIMCLNLCRSAAVGSYLILRHCWILSRQKVLIFHSHFLSSDI